MYTATQSHIVHLLIGVGGRRGLLSLAAGYADPLITWDVQNVRLQNNIIANATDSSETLLSGYGKPDFIFYEIVGNMIP